MTQQKTSPSSNKPTFFGHPRELATLFGMEVWERLSYYGMQGILLIYLYYTTTRGGLGIDQGTAVGLMGAYGSGVYLSTIVGAWCADRLFGNERTLFYSGIIVMLGHITLALVPDVFGVIIGLVLIAFGSGGVKATCAAMAGALYHDDSERRDAGFSIFYMGVNLGGLAGPLLTGLLQENLGFHYGFGLAAIGMAIGLAQYTRGRKRLPESEKRPPSPLSARERTNYAVGAIAFVVIVAVLVGSGWINADNLDTVFFGVIAVAAVAYFIGILSSSRITSDERKQTLIFIPLFLSSTVFWSLYLQLNTVFTLLFDQRVDRQVGGFQIPVSWLSAFESFMVICLASVLA